MDRYLNELSPVRYLSGLDFERFVLTIIQLEAKARNKKIYKGDAAAHVLKDFLRLKYIYGFHFDAVAPEGIYDSSFTIIEVKKIKDSPAEARRQIEQAIEKFKRYYFGIRTAFGIRVPMRFLLVIGCGRQILDEAYAGLREPFFYEEDREAIIDIWPIENLIEKARAYPFEFEAFKELVIHKASNDRAISFFKSELKGISKDDFKRQNDELVDELRNCFEKHRVSLVLGTGISMDFNDKLSWDALSERLYDKLDSDRRFDNPKDSMSILGGDNVSIVQYSKSSLGNSYPTVLYKLIYPKRGAYRRGNSSLDGCANLIERKTANGVRGIDKVITYNYDDYLEQSLRYRGVLYRTLYREIDYLSKEMPIYHVHGYMPEESDYNQRKQYIKTIILSEEDYFNTYGDSSNWNVAIQLETFKDDICLFVGNSISDFNEKRLLNKTKQNKWKSHFAIIHTKGLGFSDLAKIYMHFFYELNVKVIWAETFEDIPSILATI